MAPNRKVGRWLIENIAESTESRESGIQLGVDNHDKKFHRSHEHSIRTRDSETEYEKLMNPGQSESDDHD